MFPPIFKLVVITVCLGINLAELTGDCKTDLPNLEELKVYRSSVRPEGDTRPRVTLVAMFPIHRGTDCSDLVCVKNYNGFQRMEIFVWTLNKINSLPERKLFVESLIYDSCSDTLAEHPIRVLNDAKARVSGAENMIIGVVGASYSSVTQPFSKATLALNLPLISYASSRNSLSEYAMFARTVWSDDVQAKAIYDILRKFKLTSFKVLGTREDSNSNGIESNLKEEMEQKNTTSTFSTCKIVKFPQMPNSKNQCTCVRRKPLLPRTTSVRPNIRRNSSAVNFPGGAVISPQEDDIEHGNKEVDLPTIAAHITESKVDAFVVAIKAESKIDFLKELRRMKESGAQPRRLQLIATDTWDISDDLSVYGVDDFLQGSITIVPENSPELEGILKDHLKNLTSRMKTNPNSDDSNPWLREVWSSVSCCKDPEDCAFIDVDGNFSVDTKVENVMNTAIIYAESIEKFFEACAYDQSCFYEEFSGTVFFRDYIMNVYSNLNQRLINSTEDGLSVRLDCDGNSFPKYAIYQFFKNKFEKIGSWKDDRLNIKPLIELRSRSHGNGGTLCNPVCTDGKYKVYDRVTTETAEYDDCCYSCQGLPVNAIHQNGRIKHCPKGSWPNEAKDACIVVPVENGFDASYPPATIQLVFNTLGTVAVIGVGILLGWNRENDIIKKTGVHYVPFLLTGALLCQLLGLGIFILPLTPVSCFLLHLIAGTGPTFLLAAILVKTHKMHEIFITTFQSEEDKSFKGKSLCPQYAELIISKLSMKSRQIVGIGIFISVQALLVLCLTSAFNTNKIIDIYPASRHIQVCNVNVIECFYSQIFNILLLVLCITYAYMARHVPSDFNETKYISFAVFGYFLILMSGACVLLAIHESAGFSKDSKAHDPELEICVFSFMLSFSALFTIGMMFTNKLHMLIKQFFKDRQPKRDSTGDVDLNLEQEDGQ